MSDGVVSHVDGRIRERLNEIVLIPSESRAEAKAARNTPFFEPVDGFVEALEIGIEVSVEVGRVDVIFHKLLPLFLTIGDVPLITVGNHTEI